MTNVCPACISSFVSQGSCHGKHTFTERAMCTVCGHEVECFACNCPPVKPVEAPHIPDHVSEFLRIAESAIRISNSGANWNTKYDLIFSEDVTARIHTLGFYPDYYDPDTSYEEDVKAFISALEEKVREIKKSFGIE